jgi:hypothetical protein
MFSNVAATSTSLDVVRLLHSHFVWMSFALALLGFSPLVKNLSLKLIRKNRTFSIASDAFLIAVLVIAIIRISASTHNPFIYFQF